MKPDDKEAENIRVAVRCRPMNDRENREQAVSCFTCGPNGTAVLTNMENPTEKHEFGFDFVYGCDSKQESVFEDIGMPLLDRAFGGYNGTIFAYGQTGSGKSFSMTGVTGGPEALEGLIPRVNRAIFERVAKERVENPNKRFLVECSFFEIYNEIIYDLLDSSGNGKKNKGGLEIKEHSVLGIYVKDLQERVVDTREEIVELMTLGAQSRTVGYTQMNAESSRSHSIFTIKIHQKDADDETKSVFAKINLVDLAGSERAASTGAQGDRLREGANINKSLSALGNVINALVEASRASKKVFIPYRNSKLTRVLQESLGGNSLCSMLATLSPANINFPETLSTLKYASRAKSIKVNAKKNEASSQISQLNEEIAALKQKLVEQMEATLGFDPKEKDEIVKRYEKQIQEMDRVRLQTWEDKAKLSKQHEMERKKLARERAIADQRIREERTKKWRLLEEKGDLELMMRALRDLDGNNATTADATAASVAVQWLETAQKVKMMEGEAKDLRMLIQVFRDSLQKDVEVWARRCGLNQDSSNASKSTKNLLPQRREDSAAASAAHMTASQMGSKLQNIGDESDKLLALEGQLVSDRNLLKTDVIPVKLFARPPVRFLHDVISAVMRNTGFAIDAVSAAQRDYAQLATKTERAEYLSAVLDHVQAWYQRQQQNVENSPSVIIAATTSNILAGKEPTDTVQFLGYFALAAMDHALRHPPEVVQEQGASDTPPTSRAEEGPETDAATPQNVSIPLAEDPKVVDGSRAGRYLQLTCVKWHHRAALQCEVFGREAHESSALAQNIQALASKARELLEQLRHTAALVLEEARALYDRAKVAESEKHAQLASYGEELAKLRAARAAWEKQQREMQEQHAHLSAQLDTANQRADREKARGDSLQGELTQATSQGEDFKRRGDTLQTQLSEKEHQIQTLSMQAVEQKRTHEALQQTKQQLEELASNLRAQLTNNKQQQDASQQEGQSRIAELNGELMSVRVQLDEQRRALEAAELQAKEQEAFGQQQYSLLQQTRAALMEKEAEADTKLKARAAESEAAIRALHDEHDRVKQELERALAAENLLKLAAGRLEVQCSAAGAELDNWRRRAEAAEAEVQTQAQALSAGAEGNGTRSDNTESDAAARENERLLLEAQTNDLRRLAELEKTEAKVQSLERELAATEEKARQTEQALLESAKRVKELEETEEELQLQLQVVTDERDSARQKEEQLFAETNEKDQEIERIRDGYVWVTDRMNSKEDELSEMQEQLERYHSLLEMTGSKVTGSDNAASSKPKEDKLGAEIAKLYVLAIGTTDGATGSDVMVAKLAEWIEVAKRPAKASSTIEHPTQQTPKQHEPETMTVKEDEVKPSATTPVEGGKVEAEPAVLSSNNAEEEGDYEDDFDEADETDEARKARRKSTATN
ncbi:hypothetical protein PF010_g3472 [Phytophthora fragariae]|uniref:Kinesin motor domain-containing protein n=1 Tax=Phytophthora fragariae TaxID=53985 RepID=A0A6G0LV01_9STRA|nr:hypothetical protein PF010_g3472 [Phytophthora fragariae]